MSKESQGNAPPSEEKLLRLTPEEVKKTTSGVGEDVKMTKFKTEHQKKFKMAAKRSAATKPQQKKRTMAKPAAKEDSILINVSIFSIRSFILLSMKPKLPKGAP